MIIHHPGASYRKPKTAGWTLRMLLSRIYGRECDLSPETIRFYATIVAHWPPVERPGKAPPGEPTSRRPESPPKARERRKEGSSTP